MAYVVFVFFFETIVKTVGGEEWAIRCASASTRYDR